MSLTLSQTVTTSGERATASGTWAARASATVEPGTAMFTKAADRGRAVRKKTWVQALRWGSVAPTPTDSLAPTATYTTGGVEGVGFGVAAVLDAVQALASRVASRTSPTARTVRNARRGLTAPPPRGPGARRHRGPAGAPPPGAAPPG